MEQLLNKTYQLAAALKKMPLYKEIIELNNLICNKYNKELELYQESFLKFSEAYTLREYYPQFKEISLAYQKHKKELYEKEEVKRYFKLEKEFSKILTNITKQIINTVSNYSEIEGAYCKWK